MGWLDGIVRTGLDLSKKRYFFAYFILQNSKEFNCLSYLFVPGSKC